MTIHRRYNTIRALQNLRDSTNYPKYSKASEQSKRLTKWLSVRLRTKWFWVRVHLQSLEYSLCTQKNFIV